MVTPTGPAAGPGEGTPDAYFDTMWASGDDPWSHRTRWYEARKYRLTAAALPEERCHRLFEPGCGVGELTALLAERADEVVAMERSPRGVDVTRRRGLPGVDVRLGRIPDDWPDGRFDVVVLSELLYYLPRAGVRAALARAGASLVPGGHVLAVHYRQDVPEHVLAGDDVRALTDAVPGWEPRLRMTDPSFALDLYRVAG